MILELNFYDLNEDKLMGNIRSVKCSCGFQKAITIGAFKAEHLLKSKFPFYCSDCGLVEVNVKNNPLLCPVCKSSQIQAYGKPPISLTQESCATVQCGEYATPVEGNLCPKCNKMTLVFEPVIFYFD